MSKWHDLSGEQKDQLLITTDKEGKPIGTATRSICHNRHGRPHLAFLAFIFDEHGSIYLQKRSNNKSLWDGYWDASVVSHVLPGETVERAAQRRGKEELGVEVEFRDLGGFYYFSQYNGNCENEFCHVLVGKTSDPINFNPVEIEMTRQISINELISDMNTKSIQITPWLRIALEKFNKLLNLP